MFFSKTQRCFLGKVSLVSCLALALFLGGCGSKLGQRTVKTDYYRNCYQPITQIRADEDAKTRNTVAGAMVGALIGGVVGYQQKGGKGAAIGAASGALVGGAASYLITDSIQKKNQAERFAAYSQALDQDIRGLQNAVAAARLTAKCYENAYLELEKAYKAGKVSRSEMVARLTEIRDGTNDANVILANYSAAMADNQMVYRDIQKAEAKQGSKSLSKSQMQTIGNKEKQLSQINSDTQREIDALKQLNQRCNSQLKTITARTEPAGSNLAWTGRVLPVCPAAGAE